jgi:hypothetical protein
MKAAWEEIKPVLKDAIVGIMDYIIAALRQNSTLAWLFFGETDTEKAEKSKRAVAFEPEHRMMSQAISSSAPSETHETPRRGWRSGQQNSSVAPTAPEGKASGGPIKPGTYLVGEKGPELISTGSSGDVITNENITALLQRLEKVGQGNISATSIETLNTTMREVLKYVKETADYTKRTVDATRSLNGNLFPAP